MKLSPQLRAHQSSDAPPPPRGAPPPERSLRSRSPHESSPFVCVARVFLLLCLFSAFCVASLGLARSARSSGKKSLVSRVSRPPSLRFSARCARCCHREVSSRWSALAVSPSSLAAARPCRPSPCSASPSTAQRSRRYRELRLALSAAAAAAGFAPPRPSSEGSAVLVSAVMPLSELQQKRKALGRWHSESFAQYSSLARKILNCKRLVWADVGSCGSSDRNRQARNVVVAHTVTALPFYHSPEALSSPNFQLCAFPLEKVSARLRAPSSISQRKGAYKITLVVLQALQKRDFV